MILADFLVYVGGSTCLGILTSFDPLKASKTTANMHRVEIHKNANVTWFRHCFVYLHCVSYFSTSSYTRLISPSTTRQFQVASDVWTKIYFLAKWVVVSMRPYHCWKGAQHLDWNVLKARPWCGSVWRIIVSS